MMPATYDDLVRVLGRYAANDTVRNLEAVANITHGNVVPFNYQKRYQKAFNVLIETNFALKSL